MTILVNKLVSIFPHETCEFADETSFLRYSGNEYSRKEFFCCSLNECLQNELLGTTHTYRCLYGKEMSVNESLVKNDFTIE